MSSVTTKNKWLKNLIVRKKILSLSPSLAFLSQRNPQNSLLISYNRGDVLNVYVMKLEEGTDKRIKFVYAT